ncbi:unnamed protein product [Symbiodinium sp. CCMP2592]|nr:unnamed protein product [Symbiodinium sp. CCMP2592]
MQDVSQYLRVLQVEAAYAGPLGITNGHQTGNLALFTEGVVFEVCPISHFVGTAPVEPPLSLATLPPIPPCVRPDADTAPEEDADSDACTHSTTTVRATFLVLRLECADLTVHCEFEAPASAQEALDAVALAMPHDVYLHWSQVREVLPQISPQWGIAIALPAWAHEEPILIYNLLRVDGRLYAAATAFEITLEYLCRTAKVSADEVDVYAYGSAHPLEEHDLLQVAPYRVIFFVPKHSDPAVGHSFRAMLCTSYSWFNCVMPPPVGGPTTRKFCLVTHACHRLHDFAQAEAPFRAELAEALGIVAADLQLQFAVPCHQDVVLEGVTCRSIVAATHTQQDVAFVDCRPLLQGWHLLQFRQGRYPHSDLVQDLGHFMPAHHHVQIDGAEIDDDDLLLVPGQVLIAQFVPITSPSQLEEDEESGPPTDDSDLSDDSEGTIGQDTTTAPADSDGEHLFDDGVGGATDPSRSRTPPRRRSATVANPVQARLWSAVALMVFASGILSFGSPTRAQPAYLDLDMHRCCLTNSGCAPTNPCPRNHPFPRQGGRLSYVWVCVGVLLLLRFAVACRLRQCKTHQEPRCSTPAERSRLNNLRQATAALGVLWPYDPAYQPHGLNPEEPSTPVSEISDAESIAWATALIYTPGTDPEFLTVAFHFPATLAEGLAMIQSEREPSQARKFPSLVPALPQTVPGAGVWIAAPHWDPDKCILLVDASRWDGRIFAAVCPTYLTQADALRISGLTDRQLVHIYLGDDPELGQHPQHVRQGMTLTISPTGHRPDLQVRIDVMMRRPSMWAQDFDFPPDDRIAYCAVCGDQHVLLEYDQTRPTQYRRQLAAALGLRHADISVFPSSPRVTNVALEGVHCRTVLAVTDAAAMTSSDRAFLVIVDCRALLQGWQAITVTDGQLYVDRVKDAVQTTAPPLYEVIFPDIPTGEVLYPVLPGQVLQVEVAPRAISVPHLLPIHPPPDDVYLPVNAASNEPNRPAHASEDALQPTQSADSPEQDASASETDEANGADGQFVEATFLLLAPGYVPEVVNLRVSIPQMPHAMLARVSAARLPEPRRRFPRLLSVSAQTFPHWGTLIVSPSWDPTGVIVCFDSRIDNRLFALDVPPFVTRADVLRLAGVNPDPNILVYHNSTPQPLDATTQVQVHLADLFLLLPREHDFFVTADFSDMIRDPEVWRPPPTFPGVHRNNVWIMSDDRSFAHVMQRGRNHLLRQDLSQIFQCMPARLIIDGDIITIEYLTHTQALEAPPPTPPPGSPPDSRAGQDWLDNDIEPLLQDRKDINDLLPCAWAFGVWAITPIGKVLIGHASGTATPMGTPYHVGETSDTPQVAEQLALFWALCWIVEWAPGYRCSVTVHYDSLVAGRGTFGDWQLPAEPGTGKASDLAHHLVHLRQIASRVVPLTHQHVKGHAGVLENEFADHLAKQARRQPEDFWTRMLPLWPASFVAHSLSAWAWMLFDPSRDVPTLFSLQTEAHRMQALDARPTCSPFAPPGRHIRAANQHIGMRLPGRKALLKAQLRPLSPLFVGLQETRLPEDSTQPDSDYLILQSSATERGHGGCALWIAKRVPYAVCAGKPCFVTSDVVNVLSASPRHLAVTISATHLHLLVLVAHCPSAAKTPISEYEAFWRQRVHDLTRRPPGYDFLVLTDANARVGSITSECIGSYASETENPPGEVLHEVLHSLAAFLPTTFPDIHVGPSVTWVSPFGDGHRIDYFIVPQHWTGFSLRTKVLTHLELLQAKDDHFPVHLQCTGSTQAPPAFYQPKLASPVRPVRPDNPQTAASLQQALCNFLPPSWSEDVDDHYHYLADFWRTVGGQWAPAATHKPTQPYISQASEHLVQVRQGLRGYLKQEASERQRRRLIICLAAWMLFARGQSFGPGQLATVARWTAEIDYSEAEAWHRFHNAGELLRRQVALDRRTYLQQLASEVSLQDVRNPKRLYAAVRKAFPTTRPAKRSSIKALPAVETPSGELAVTAEDRIATWRDHFASQETGTAITGPGYIAHMRDLPAQTGPGIFDVNALPTLGEIEAITLTLRTGRAAGADSITSELLQLHVPTTARQMFAVFLKATAGLREPVLFRGGELVCLAKKAGAALRCSSYRSILISSVPGKVLHRRLRGQLIDRLQITRPALQAGAIPGEGIEHISLAAQSFLHLRDARREPWALIFYDVQAAFYSVIRELITPHTHTDNGLLELLHRMALPPAAVSELRDKLRDLALLPQLGTSSHVTALVQDLYKGTWFRITGSALLTLTERGTRPGDPAADAVFGRAMSALLRSIDEAMDKAGLLPHTPRITSPHQWADTTDAVSWGCPAWADDFVQPVDGDSPCDLLNRVQLSVGLVSAKVSSLGMKLTFEREKTAALIPPWIPRDLPPQCLTQNDSVYIPITDALTHDEHVLFLVDAYKHLGGIITANASPIVDLHHRHSRALAVIKPLRRRLFACRDIPLPTRRTLLRSLAISKFAHTGAAIFLQAAFHRRLWSQQYVGLWRSLFMRQSATRSIHAYRVLHAAQAPSPPLALARARAGFLARLTAAGPTVLTYLLYMHWCEHRRSSWLHQLEQDFEAVSLYVPDVANCVPNDQVVPSLLTALVEQPRWWLHQTIKACKEFQRHLERWMDSHDRSQPPPATPVSRPYACPYCPSSFALRKHLGVHLARTHSVLSPSRHFAPVTHCLACLKHYGTVARVQMHLRSRPQCLWRCAHLFAPMDHDTIQQVEKSDREAAKRLRLGSWKTFTAPCQSAFLHGPLLPTADERLPDPSSAEDQITLSELAAPFKPKASTLQWLQEYLDSASTEGPRQSAVSFWGHKPCFTNA